MSTLKQLKVNRQNESIVLPQLKNMNSHAQLVHKNAFHHYSSKAKLHQRSTILHETIAETNAISHISTNSLPALGNSLQSLHTKKASFNTSVDNQPIGLKHNMSQLQKNKAIKSYLHQPMRQNHQSTNQNTSPMDLGWQYRSESRLLQSKSTLADPNYILMQYKLCKNENFQRLEKIDRLEDLIKFKVKTVAGVLEEANNGLQISQDSLMENEELDTRINSIQKDSSNILLDHPYNSIQVIEGQQSHQSSIFPQGNTQSQLYFTYDKNSYSPQQARNLPGHNNDSTIEMLKNICDPLLSKNVSKWQHKKSKKDGKSIENYEIPENLKKQPKNFNRYIPLKEIIPKHEKSTLVKPITEEKSKEQALKERVENKLKEIEEKVKIQQKKATIDPIDMLKQYFDGRNTSKKLEKPSDEKIDGGPSLDKKIYSSNYVVAKYEKLKADGKLRNFDESPTKFQQESILSANNQNVTVDLVDHSYIQGDLQPFVDVDVIQSEIIDNDDLEHTVKAELEENTHGQQQMLNTANFPNNTARDDHEGTAPTLSRAASTADFKDSSQRQGQNKLSQEPEQTISVTIGGEQKDLTTIKISIAEENESNAKEQVENVETLIHQSKAVSPTHDISDETNHKFKEILSSVEGSTLHEQSMTNLDLKHIEQHRKPRFSVLKQFQSIQSSKGDATYYVPYSKDQIELIKRFQIQRELQRSNSRTSKLLNKDSQNSMSTLVANFDHEGSKVSIHTLAAEKDPKVLVKNLQQSRKIVIQKPQATLMVPNKLDIQLQLPEEQDFEAKRKSSQVLKIPQVQASRRKFNQDLSQVNSSINSDHIKNANNEDIMIKRKPISNRKEKKADKTGKDAKKPATEHQEILAQENQLQFPPGQKPVHVDIGIGKFNKQAPMNLFNNDQINLTQTMAINSHETSQNGSLEMPSQNKFLFIKNEQNMTGLRSKNCSESPPAMKHVSISDRQLSKLRMRPNQQSFFDKQGNVQPKSNLNKTGETFKIKSDVDRNSNENFVQVVEVEEQTTTENILTGQTERIQIFIKDSNEMLPMQPKLGYNTKHASPMDKTLIKKIIKGTQKQLTTVEQIVEKAAGKSNRKSNQRNEDLNYILTKKGKMSVSAKKENLSLKQNRSGSSTQNEITYRANLTAVQDVMTLIGNSNQNPDSSRFIDTYESQPTNEFKNIKATNQSLKAELNQQESKNQGRDQLISEILVNNVPLQSDSNTNPVKIDQIFVIPQPEDIYQALSKAEHEENQDYKIMEGKSDDIQQNQSQKVVQIQQVPQSIFKIDTQKEDDAIQKVIEQHFQKRDSWVPYRFKKFPRFGQQNNERSAFIQEYNNSQLQMEFFSLKPFGSEGLSKEGSKQPSQNVSPSNNRKQKYNYILVGTRPLNENLSPELEQTIKASEKQTEDQLTEGPNITEPEERLTSQAIIQTSSHNTAVSPLQNQIPQEIIAKIPSPRKAKLVPLLANDDRRLSSIDSIVDSEQNSKRSIDFEQNIQGPKAGFETNQRESLAEQTSSNQVIVSEQKQKVSTESIIQDQIQDGQMLTQEIEMNQNITMKEDQPIQDGPMAHMPVHIKQIAQQEPDRTQQRNQKEILFDPFQRVFISKQIDNQILTSNRTLLQENNIFSETLKVVHKRFRAPQKLNEATEKRIKSQGKTLYITDEQFKLLPDEGIIELPNEDYYYADQLGQTRPNLLSGARNSVLSDSVYLNVQFPVYDDLKQTEKSDHIQTEKILSPNKKNSQVIVARRSKSNLAQRDMVPVAVYDISGGQDFEERGYGYLRGPYVMASGQDNYMSAERTKEFIERRSIHDKNQIQQHNQPNQKNIIIKGSQVPIFTMEKTLNNIDLKQQTHYKDNDRNKGQTDLGLAAQSRPESMKIESSKKNFSNSPSLDLASVERLDQLLQKEDTTRINEKSPIIQRTNEMEPEQHELIVSVKSPNIPAKSVQDEISDRKAGTSTQQPASAQMSYQNSGRATANDPLRRSNDTRDIVTQRRLEYLETDGPQMYNQNVNLKEPHSQRSENYLISKGQSVQRTSIDTEFSNGNFQTIDRRVARMSGQKTKQNNQYRYKPEIQLGVKPINLQQVGPYSNIVNAQETTIGVNKNQILKSEVSQRQIQIGQHTMRNEQNLQPTSTRGLQEKGLNSKGSHAGFAQTFGLLNTTNEVWNQASLRGLKPSDSSYLPGRKLTEKDKEKKQAKIQIRVKNIQKQSSMLVSDDKDPSVNKEVQEALNHYTSGVNAEKQLQILNLLKKHKDREVNSVISELVKKNQRYEPKVPQRGELLQNNSLIFDLSKLNNYPDTLIDSLNVQNLEDHFEGEFGMVAAGSQVKMEKNNEEPLRRKLNPSPLRH